MAKSMTAFGRATSSADGMNITVELKSVNSRFFDPQVKLGRSYSFLEEKVKSSVQGALSRGKVDIYIGIEQTESPSQSLTLDKAYLQNYLTNLYALRDEFGLVDDISVMKVAQNKEIFTVVRDEPDADAIWQAVEPVLQEALAAFTAMREAEGERLKVDLLAKKSHLCELAAEVSAQSERCVAAYHDKFLTRIRQILGEVGVEIDEQRVLTECAIYTDKIAIDEELVRLASHFKAFDEIFESDQPIGRKLDFLLQEMNRETNTIGSKCIDADIARIVVDMKSELEKIREQIQNLE